MRPISISIVALTATLLSCVGTSAPVPTGAPAAPIPPAKTLWRESRTRAVVDDRHHNETNTARARDPQSDEKSADAHGQKPAYVEWNSFMRAELERLRAVTAEARSHVQ
jgi:hypothetical protein